MKAIKRFFRFMVDNWGDIEGSINATPPIALMFWIAVSTGFLLLMIGLVSFFFLGDWTVPENEYFLNFTVCFIAFLFMFSTFVFSAFLIFITLITRKDKEAKKQKQ